MTEHKLTVDAFDNSFLRRAFGRFATGVAIITTRSPQGKMEGLTANAFTAVSLDPPLLLWNLQRSARSLPSFQSAGGFAIHVLGAHQHKLMQHFAKPAADKFSDIAVTFGYRGIPILPSCLAIFECSTEKEMIAGDHIIFLGRIERISCDDGDPLIISRGQCLEHKELSAIAPFQCDKSTLPNDGFIIPPSAQNQAQNP